MVDISIVCIKEKKETPNEFATRKLGNVGRLIHKYGKLFEQEKFSMFIARFIDLTERLTFDGSVDTRQVVELSREVGSEVTAARAQQIRTLVERNMENWLKSRFGEEFTKTEAFLQTTGWLEGTTSGNTRVVRSWIDAGWFILTDVLVAPWGKCVCGKKLLPRLIGPEGSKKWRVFVKCGDCYHQQRAIEERQMLATLGEGKPRVKKPGSAAKRGQHKEEGAQKRRN